MTSISGDPQDSATLFCCLVIWPFLRYWYYPEKRVEWVRKEQINKSLVLSPEKKVNFIYFEVVLVLNIKHGEETLSLVSP